MHTVVKHCFESFLNHLHGSEAVETICTVSNESSSNASIPINMAESTCFDYFDVATDSIPNFN